MKLLTSHVLRDHVLLGGVVALFLIPFFGLQGFLLFWTATVFLDLDHYFHFVLRSRFKSLGIGPMFRFHEQIFARIRRPEFIALEPFHTLEFLLLIGLLTLWASSSLQPIFWGVFFHNLVDLVHLACYRAVTKRAYSFIEYMWRRKRMRSRGNDPNLIFLESLNALNPQGDHLTN